MNHKLVRYTASFLAVGFTGVAVGAESGHKEQPHAQYVAVAPGAGIGNNANIALGNASSASATVTVEYHAAPLNLEQLIPHDRLVIQTNGLSKK